jgi:flavin reductase (DIM6/NTAB) family NADH-FMN oxidoreductase RutF
MSMAANAARTYAADDLAEIAYSDCGADVSFRLFQDSVVPRPVFLLSTISGGGVNNVAPYSYLCPAATTPASFVLSVLRRDDGSEKDTMVNLRSSGEVVLNSVTERIVRAANACAENLPPHVSEFEFTGLTPAFFSSRAAHVAQSPVRFECQIESETCLGGAGRGAASIVVLRVSRAFVAKDVYRGQGRIDVGALRLIGRSSVDQYLVADGQFTIPRPNTGEVAV